VLVPITVSHASFLQAQHALGRVVITWSVVGRAGGYLAAFVDFLTNLLPAKPIQGGGGVTVVRCAACSKWQLAAAREGTWHYGSCVMCNVIMCSAKASSVGPCMGCIDTG
jgi:hypothetical protein